MPNIGSLIVSRQGYGAMGLSNVYGPANDTESIETVRRAIALRIRAVDHPGRGHFACNGVI